MAVALCLCSCTDSRDPQVEAQIRDYVQDKLDVPEIEIVGWKEAVECVVADIQVPDGQTYRVILIAQNPEPRPYDVLGISQRFELEDFVGSSDVWCGVMKTDAYGKDDDGNWALVG